MANCRGGVRLLECNRMFGERRNNRMFNNVVHTYDVCFASTYLDSGTGQLSDREHICFLEEAKVVPSPFTREE